jgi:hypothetical protein
VTSVLRTFRGALVMFGAKSTGSQKMQRADGEME